jgi:hypothetical protein
MYHRVARYVSARISRIDADRGQPVLSKSKGCSRAVCAQGVTCDTGDPAPGGNRIGHPFIFRPPGITGRAGPVRRKSGLGGPLNYYERAA